MNNASAQSNAGSGQVKSTGLLSGVKAIVFAPLGSRGEQSFARSDLGKQANAASKGFQRV